MRRPRGVPTVRGMSNEQPEPTPSIEYQLIEAQKRIAELERDLSDSDLLFESNDDSRMPTKLRDVVRGQVLALLSAESREAVRCATNALGDALDKTAPPTKDDDETAEDRIAALLDNPVTQTVIQKGLEYFCPAPPPAPTPNLTVTGPRGCVVSVMDGDKQIAYRMIGDSGVVRMVIPSFAMVVRVTPDTRKGETVRMIVDFTEESHEIDAAMALAYATKNKAESAATPAAEPPNPDAPAAKKRAPKRKA